VTDSAIDI